MIRIVIENILLLLAPAAIYFAYNWLIRRGNKTGREILSDAPLVWLAAMGVALLAIVMVLFGFNESGKPGVGYAPPEYRDGKIVPGHKL
jgi:hypothetical protein